MSSASEFKMFMTIKLPANIDSDGCRKAIKGKKVGNQKMDISDYANDMLGKADFTVVVEKVKLDLIVVSVKELTGKNRTSLKEIFTQAKEQGLQLCPNQVGPELRRQYENQPEGEWLFVGMEPIADLGAWLHIFCLVRHDDVLWLSTNYDKFDSAWYGYYQFIFVRPRK